jgi:hypothetical protein
MQQRVPDALTTARQFVQGLGAALDLNDQSYAYTDAVPYNPSGQFQTLSPGLGLASVEGQPRYLGAVNVAGFALTPLQLALGVVLVGGGIYLAMR